jgi:hypothetical protein
MDMEGNASGVTDIIFWNFHRGLGSNEDKSRSGKQLYPDRDSNLVPP